MKSLIFIVSIAIFSCSRHNYTFDVAKNSRAFRGYLDTISKYEEGKSAVLVDSYTEAIFFLSFVTGIDSKAGYSNTIGYARRQDYENDIKLWKDWYQKNKTKLSDSYIDSVYKRLGIDPPATLGIGRK